MCGLQWGYDVCVVRLCNARASPPKYTPYIHPPNTPPHPHTTHQVLEILALRRFGWRTYSQFAIDFRKADAMAARRLWVTSNALTASTYITYISTVLMAITGIVLFAFPSEQDISDAVAVPVLTLNCIGLVFSLVVLTGTLWVVRERRRHRCVGGFGGEWWWWSVWGVHMFVHICAYFNKHTYRWVFMADLGLALMYSVPIINYVLMKTSVTAPGDTTETMAVSALIMVCIVCVYNVCIMCIFVYCCAHVLLRMCLLVPYMYNANMSTCTSYCVNCQYTMRVLPCVLTTQVIVLTITWGLLHLVLYQWSTLDKSVMDALSQPTDTECTMFYGCDFCGVCVLLIFVFNLSLWYHFCICVGMHVSLYHMLHINTTFKHNPSSPMRTSSSSPCIHIMITTNMYTHHQYAHSGSTRIDPTVARGMAQPPRERNYQT